MEKKRLKTATHRQERTFSATQVTDFSIRPSTGFLSNGRKPSVVKNDELALSYFPKKHEHKKNSISILAYRDQTLKTMGITAPYEADAETFKSLR